MMNRKRLLTSAVGALVAAAIPRATARERELVTS
jgi:hypothetical protein